MNTTEIISGLVAVKLTVRGWTGRYNAKDAARAAEQAKGTEEGTIDASVLYMPEELATQIARAAGSIRSAWDARTLPWEDGGWRIVKSSAYLDLLDAIAKPKSEWRAVVDALLARYSMLKDDAKRRLNGMFDEARFPTKEAMEERFSVETYSRGIQAASDMRIEGLTDGAMQTIRASVEKQYEAQIREAVASLILELRGLCDEMITACEKTVQERTRYGGLIARVRRSCEAARKLNILNDPKLDAAFQSVGETLTRMDPDVLREKPLARRTMAASARSLASMLDAAL